MRASRTPAVDRQPEAADETRNAGAEAAGAESPRRGCSRKTIHALQNVSCLLWIGGLLVGAYVLGESRFYDLTSVRGWVGLLASVLGIGGGICLLSFWNRSCHCDSCIRRMNAELAAKGVTARYLLEGESYAGQKTEDGHNDEA